MKKPNTVDEYIISAPGKMQAKLHELRAAIKSVVPEAEEKISYGMPYYGYKGRLVYFAYAKNHIGLYPVPPITQMYSKELTRYKTGKATIQFPLSEKLPIALIKKLVKARAKINEESDKK